MKKVKHVITETNDYSISIFMILLANFLLGVFMSLCSVTLYFFLMEIFHINHDIVVIFSTILFCYGMFYGNVSFYNNKIYNPMVSEVVEHEIIETGRDRK